MTPTALGYYLDRGRIHATTVDAVADEVFAAAQADLARGADVLMIAPDLQLVAALNERARAVRLRTRRPTRARRRALSGGETASAGDLIITKRKNRAPAPSAAPITSRTTTDSASPRSTDDGSLTVRHTGCDRSVTAARRLRDASMSGSATPPPCAPNRATPSARHTRAGIAHIVITDRLGAAELYMGMTRGTGENHAWVITSGDGEAHNVIYPEAQSPATAVEVLTTILAREDPNRSALTELAEAADPALQLADTAAGLPLRLPHRGARPDRPGAAAASSPQRAEQAVPGVTAAPAWEYLQAHLAGIDLTGVDPIAELADAAASRELGTRRGHRRGAGLPDRPEGHRLDRHRPTPLAARPARRGVLRPGLRPLPAATGHPDPRTHPARSASRGRAAGHRPTRRTGHCPTSNTPSWCASSPSGAPAPPPPDTDLRPAGPPGETKAMRGHRARLVERALAVSGVTAGDAAARWAALIEDLDPRIAADESWPVIAGRLNTADALGLNVTHLDHRRLRPGSAARPNGRPTRCGGGWRRT